MPADNTNKADLIDLAFKVMSMLIIPVGIYIFNSPKSTTHPSLQPPDNSTLD